MNEEFEFDEEAQELKTEDDIPLYGSVKWEEYVMNRFLPNELYNESYPTLNGMRRVALELLGEVYFSGPESVVTHAGHSFCVYELRFSDHKIFRAAADAHEGNISGPYVIYPTAIAESRAEARAYRKALMISTVSAEEVKGSEKTFNSVLETLDTENTFNEEDGISDQQKMIIKSKCKKLGINLEKFLEDEGFKQDFDKVTKGDGKSLCKKISEFQQKGIPEYLK